ncbi:unnamed protein product [Toxocara canis]|uniref:3-methyladenine DNA glycosylase n=1 Tax=Toxocara canis TaxID=6265 RepID=A0A183UD10_TOXCA|nr:unnamed protein product [Toxocara canis]
MLNLKSAAANFRSGMTPLTSVNLIEGDFAIDSVVLRVTSRRQMERNMRPKICALAALFSDRPFVCKGEWGRYGPLMGPFETGIFFGENSDYRRT